MYEPDRTPTLFLSLLHCGNVCRSKNSALSLTNLLTCPLKPQIVDQRLLTHFELPDESVPLPAVYMLMFILNVLVRSPHLESECCIEPNKKTTPCQPPSNICSIGNYCTFIYSMFHYVILYYIRTFKLRSMFYTEYMPGLANDLISYLYFTAPQFWN